MSGGLGSLVGTLTPEGSALTMKQVQERQQQDELAALMAQLSGAAATQGQQAQQAGQDYQQAAAAPPPQLDPLSAFLPSLMSNLGSVIAENPAYRQNRQQDIAQQKQDLMTARVQNLQALRDNFDKLAESAKAAQDFAAEAKYRTKAESLAKTQKDILDIQHGQAAKDAVEEAHRNTMDVESLRSKTDLEIARINAASRGGTGGAGGVSGEFDPAQYVTKTAPSDAAPDGREFVDLSSLNGKQRDAVSAWASKNGVIALNAQDATAIKDVSRARLDMISLNDYVQGLLPADAATRSQKYVGMKISKLLQTNEQRAAFRTWRDTAIPTLRGMAGSRGLRISQQQIQLMVDNLPKDDDTIGTAQRKLRTINTLLTNAETPLLTRNWGKVKAAGVGGNTVKDTAPVVMLSPKGVRRTIEAWEVPEAVKHGWTRSK